MRSITSVCMLYVGVAGRNTFPGDPENVEDTMKPNQLTLRCYAEKLSDGQWQAFCLDLCLAAQGESFADVRKKLNDMTREYVYDALAGKDKEFAFKLLRRRAPLQYWVRFYFLLSLQKIGMVKDGMARLFCPPIPLEPTTHHA